MLSLINQQFIEAAQDNQLDELKNLLSQGADIHADIDAALRYSAFRGHLEIVKFLFAKGVNIHAKNDEALRSSALNGRLEIVKFLVGSTGASSCLCGMPVLPNVGSIALVPAFESMRELSSVGADPKNKLPSITKAKRSKI